MKIWSVISFGLATCLAALHGFVLYRLRSPQRDPNGYVYMVLFFCGVPLAITVVVVSVIALRTTKKKRFKIPLAIGALPLLGWPIIFLLESFRLIP